uniref:Methylesterase 1 n=2 Tax=Noccaea caerulescens TaxID=107243 RepID=A0A1J3I8M2_NOCCA
MSVERKNKQHFVLVHGPCHGGWYWYKVKPLLEAAGHRVTAIDLAASGINTNPSSITEVFSCDQYTEPLLKLLSSLPSDEKVVLVGQSTGGLSLAIAMDKFPDKISVAVFATAFMPDTKNSPAFVVDKFFREAPPEAWMGTEFVPYGEDGVSMSFSPEFVKKAVYTSSPKEDIELVLLLKRPGSLFINELSKREKFSEKGYGSVPRAFIVSKDDKALTEEYQRWMIDNYPADYVTEMEGTDHIPMISNPQLLSQRLLEIGKKFA